MPLLRTETIHGWPCKFYDNGTVNVGTFAADRFSIKLPPDEGAWFTTRLRAELIDFPPQQKTITCYHFLHVNNSDISADTTLLETFHHV